MLRFGALIAAAACVAMPAHAQQMNAREARAFVVGKLFTYQCFEGTRGAGRIMENGAVAGTIQFRGNGATRYAMLPQNTIRVVGDRVCASVKGVPFEPCFNIIRTSHNSFRGSISGMGFAYCDFVRRDRPMVASVEQPEQSQPLARGRGKAGAPMDLQANREAATRAFPKPIESSDLPAVNEKPAEHEVAAVRPVEDKAAEAKATEVTRVEAIAVEAKPAQEIGAEANLAPGADEKPALRPAKD